MYFEALRLFSATGLCVHEESSWKKGENCKHSHGPGIWQCTGSSGSLVFSPSVVVGNKQKV